MNKLIEGMSKAQNYTLTENGALTHESSLSEVLDFFYHASARRGQDNTDLFARAYAESPSLAVLAAFYTRDVRGGQGERNTFRQVLRYLFENDRDVFNAVVTHVPEYGRWDDALEFVKSPVVVAMVVHQLNNDVQKSPSLLAKWMPSINTSSKKTRTLAKAWVKALGMSERSYRLMLSDLRKRIGIVERLMSAGQFDAIDYERVPSRAAMIYRKAFSKRDTARYAAYLEAVTSGEKKIKAATLYPYEIVGKYLNGMALDSTLEEQWKALPNYCDEPSNALVIADVSGSMAGVPLSVSISLAIYIAERNKGAFHNYFMTFSSRPRLERVIGRTLKERVRNLSKANWNMSTDLQAAFDAILASAVHNSVPAEEMPKTLFIISDMQFDKCVDGYTNYNRITKRYAEAGYELPKIVFWNVASRRDEVPIEKYQSGTYLVSGCSPSIFKSAINARATNPYELMLEVLLADRYAPILNSL